MAKVNNNQEKKSSGGSTLKKLKSNLKNLGLIGKPQRPKKRRSALSTKSEKEERVEKLQRLRSQPNQFELKFNKQKSHVLGRRVQGTMGRPGVAKKKSQEIVRSGVDEGEFLC